jgi:hypothetical protein
VWEDLNRFYEGDLPMKNTWMAVGIALALLMTGQTFKRGSKPRITSSIISSGQLPHHFASGRTYHVPFSSPAPESLLTSLWKAKLRVSQAWLPLDNTCMGPVGPQFTVELVEKNPKILTMQFVAGDGRLSCATRLKRYVIR